MERSRGGSRGFPRRRLPANAASGGTPDVGAESGSIAAALGLEGSRTNARRHPPHDRHHRHHRPRDPRQPRQPDRRGRRLPRGRLDGPRGGAVRRLDRRARGGGTARRRRRATCGKGVHKAVEAVNGEIFEALSAASTPRTRSRIDRADDRPRRHAEQEPARRQRHPRRLAGGRQGRRRGLRPAALPLCRRRRRACPAGADDEHHQRRRARRQPDRLPGIHDHAGRRADLRRGAADGRGGLPHAEEAAEGRRPQHQCRRRRRLRPEPRLGRGSARLHHEGDREGRLPAGRGRSPWRSTAPRPSSSRTASLRSRGRGPEARRRRDMADYLAELADALSDHLDRGRHGRGRLGRLEGADRRARRQGASSSATTSSSPTPSACATASRRASPTRSSSRSTRSAR